MPTQVQIQGAVEATQEARTLVSRVLDIDTTNKRLNVHDGSTVGGVPHVNWVDEQNGEFVYGSATGTNAIAVTLSKAPSAYAAGQMFRIKAAATITAAATVNFNSLGALTLKKKDKATGALIAVAAGDIIIGGFYVIHVIDGSNALVESVDGGGLQSVSQGDLNTSTGTFSDVATGSGTNVYYEVTTSMTIPGGEHGFFVNTRASTAGVVCGWWMGSHAASSLTCQVIPWSEQSSITVHGSQRYITSSPPFDLGDGEAQGFAFLKVNKQGEVLSSYIADVPPWGYNGKTNIRADKVDRKGGKYRKVIKVKGEKGVRELSSLIGRHAQSVAELTADELLMVMDCDLIEEYEPITQEIKNRDMADIPHPFGSVGKDERVILLDPMCERLGKMIALQNEGADISSLICQKAQLGNEGLKRKCPKGVLTVSYTL